MHSAGLLYGLPAAVVNVRRPVTRARRAGPYPSSQGFSHICRCSSSGTSPDPLTAATPSDSGEESKLEVGASSRGNDESDMPSRAPIQGEDIEGEQNEVTTDSEMVPGQHDDISEVEVGSKTPQESSQEQSTVLEEDKILSVGVGNKVILLDKAKVIELGKKTAVVFFGITFTIAMVRTVIKFMSPKAARIRTVSKNRALVEELLKYLPGNREGLTQQTVWMLRLKTGFSPTEVFRKYLWFLLRERKFDQDAVDDLVHLKNALGMEDMEVAEGLKERAERIYEKYGSLMLSTEGMSSAAVERKATCKALFSKMLYLVNYEHLLEPDSEAQQLVDLREIFGATENDISRLEIVSLEDIDIDKLDEMASSDEENELPTAE